MTSMYEKPISPSQFAGAAEKIVFKPGQKIWLERGGRLIEVIVVKDYKDVLSVI